MNPIRRWISLVETRLNELEVAGGSAPPPAMIDRGRGNDPKGGEYWIKASAAVPIAGDFATMALRTPEAFALSDQDILSAAPGVMKDSSMFERAYAHYHETGEEISLSFFGARMIGMTVLFQHGWALVNYDPPSRFALQASPEHMKRGFEAAADRFALTQVDIITLHAVTEVFTPSGVKTMTFRKEDFPGFSGPFGAVIDWLTTGKLPEQHWVYAIVADYASIAGGLHSVEQRIHIGKWSGTENKIDIYLNGMTDRRPRQFNGIMIRFPLSAAPRDVRQNHEGVTQHYMLHRKQAFVIPPAAIQVKSGNHWAPLVE
jgi:hypothetical protein